MERRAEVVGTLLAHEQVTLSNEVSGRVIEVFTDFGSTVRKGQLLVRLDAREYELAAQKAEAGVAEALSLLGLAADGDARGIDVDRTPMVQQAASLLADAKTKLESARQLMQTRDIPEQRFLELQQAVATRSAALQEARDRVRVQMAAVQARRAELELARERVQDCRILAPFDGGVAARLVSVGQFVKDNTPLLTLVQTNPVRLRARIPESGAAAVRVGLPVQFRTDAYPGRSFPARVTDVSPILETESRTMLAEALVPNPDGLLRPGMFARISVQVTSDARVVMVPRAAVLAFAGINKLFVVAAGGAVAERTVQTGVEHDGWIEVTGDGVAAGELVAVNSLEQLRAGMVVAPSRR